MKLSRFLATISVAVSMLFFISSCNSGDNKKTDEPTTAADTTVAKVTVPAPAAKPANVLIIKHKVANYAKWKLLYDAHDSTRLAYGLHNYVVSRGIEDTNMVMVALRMDDAAKAKTFSALPDLKARMQKGGVLGVPSFNFVNVVSLDTSTNTQPVRVMITHKVKDWDAWKKVFDEHKQARMDAGLTDRVVSYSIGNNHMVSLVFAVSDMAKAKAFMNSKDLADKMKAGGVEGPPSIFFYRIVQKY